MQLRRSCTAAAGLSTAQPPPPHADAGIMPLLRSGGGGGGGSGGGLASPTLLAAAAAAAESCWAAAAVAAAGCWAGLAARLRSTARTISAPAAACNDALDKGYLTTVDFLDEHNYPVGQRSGLKRADRGAHSLKCAAVRRQRRLAALLSCILVN